MVAKKDARNEQEVANDDQLTKVSDLTQPETVADTETPKTVKVTSPLGHTTEVPEGILAALLESGYSKSK